MIMNALMEALGPLVVLIIGVAFFWVGWLGNQIDNHPICRKCGYDLFGLPAGAERCSECGSQVRLKWAVRVGNRRKMRGWIVVGVVLAAIGAWGLGHPGRTIAMRLQSARYKPVWWLLRDASGNNVPKRDEALFELQSRLHGQRLSKEQIRQVVERALQMQADTSRPWVSGWGYFVEQAAFQRELSVERWKRYLEQAIPTYKLEAKAKVRQGAMLPARLHYGAARVADSCSLQATYRYACIEIDGFSYAGSMVGRGGSHALTLNSASGPDWTREFWGHLEKLKPGMHKLRVMLDVEVGLRPDIAKWLSPGSVPDLKTRIPLEVSWELVDGPAIRRVEDEGLRAAVEKSLQVRVMRRASDDLAHVSVDITCKSPPLDLAWVVWARQGQKVWRIGEAAFKANTGGFAHTSATLLGLEGERIEVVFRPSVETAERQVDCGEIWDGEVVIKDVVIALPAE